MRMHHLVVTFGASATGQPLTTDKSIIGSQITIQAGPANANSMTIGGLDATGTLAVTAADYGINIPAAAAGVPAPPYPLDPWNTLGLKLSLAHIYVKGTAAQTCTVTYWN